MSFLDRKEIKDVLSFLRLIANHSDDVSCRRILNWPARGLGRTALEALSEAAFAQGVSLCEGAGQAANWGLKCGPQAGAFHALIAGVSGELSKLSSDPAEVSAWAHRMLERVGAKKGIEEDADSPEQAAARWEMVQELVHSIGLTKMHEQVTGDGHLLLREFLSRMALQAQDEQDKAEDKKDESKNQVTLLTLHGSKGLEFPVVFLVGMEDGFLPHKRSIEGLEDLSEERRLCYVGITRAKDRLYISRVKNRLRYGVPAIPVACKELPESSMLKKDVSLKSAEHEMKVKDRFRLFRRSLLSDLDRWINARRISPRI